MPSGFIPNPGFVPALLAAAEMKAAMLVVAKEKLEKAQALAPVDTGTFRGSLHIESEGPSVQIVTDDPKWVYLEYGTEDTPVFATLRRSLEGG